MYIFEENYNRSKFRSPIHSRCLCIPLWERPLLKDGNVSISVRAPSRAVETLAVGVASPESPLGCCYPPTQSSSKFTTSLMGISPLGDDREPNSAAGISPTRNVKFAGTTDGISLIQKQLRKLNKPLHIQPAIPKVGIDTLKRHGHTNFKSQW